MSSLTKKTGKTLVWILMGLLILGLGGFGITNLGGATRSVGTVGSQEITTDSYFRAVRQMLQGRTGPSGRPLTFAEAKQQGLDQITLAQLVAAAALDQETQDAGISVGDAELARQITETDAFKGLDGQFNRADYTERLRQIGMRESAYETLVRQEMSRGLLQTAIFSGVNATPSHADTVLNFIGARRDFTWALLTPADLDAELPPADDAALQAFHKDNAANYTAPATRQITYAWLTPEMLIDQIEVDDAELQRIYEERSAEFNIPERRLVERLAFANAEEAKAAKAALDAGEQSFEALVEARGLTLQDVDLGDISEPELGNAGEPVFKAAAGDIVGPVETDLGPALFRVNAVLAGESTPFEDVQDELRDEQAQSRARRMIDTNHDSYEDLLAGGATLEELTAETDMQLGHMDWHAGAEGGPAGYDAVQAEAAKLSKDDFPTLIALEDGGIIALRLDRETDAALRPFEEVREDVLADEHAARETAALKAKAEALAAQLGEGRAFTALDGITPRTEEGLTRSDVMQDAPARLLEEAFKLAKPGDSSIVSGPRGTALVQLDALLPPDETDPDLTATRAIIERQLESDLAQDLYQMVLTDIESRVPVSLNQSALNAVNAQFQ